ncbi:DUF3168 domain-containing protein [uncultured Jannaschia sp.]|uniref:DUF3168 domain-containing protein n=1 Tax=uncultured Jannaschia sp. TaxID=293347 RepID=UPI002630F7E0|nr:DUF3168 domain-containing protein [uncultured Jannaschia sp.]
MSADLAIQRALRARLVASPAVTALVPAASILDAHKRPAPRPGIILGDAQSVRVESIARNLETVTHTIHVWTEEPSTERCKGIAFAVRSAIEAARLDLGPDYHCADWDVTSARYLRDPDGVTAHGVLTVEVLAERVPA